MIFKPPSNSVEENDARAEIMNTLEAQCNAVWSDLVTKLETKTLILQVIILALYKFNLKDKAIYKSKEIEEPVSEQDEPDKELRESILNHSLVLRANDKLMSAKKVLSSAFAPLLVPGFD